MPRSRAGMTASCSHRVMVRGLRHLTSAGPSLWAHVCASSSASSYDIGALLPVTDATVRLATIAQPEALDARQPAF